MNGPYDRDATLLGLVRAVPYLRLYRGRTFVVKLGGATGADPEALKRAVEQVGILNELGIRVVLVHGGGPQTTALSKRLGVEAQFVDGRRITPPAALEAAVMALNGTVSTAVLAACRAQGLSAIGVSGLDSALIRARKRPIVRRELPDGTIASIDFGEVGDIISIDSGVITRLLDAGFVPVIASLAADDTGRVLNVNADTAAARIAVAVRAQKLIFLTDTPGILADPSDPTSLVSYTDMEGLDRLDAAGALSGGMLPKVQAIRSALDGDVPRVHVVGHAGGTRLLAEVFTNEGAGTLIVRDTTDLAPDEQHATPRVSAKGGGA